MCKINLELLVDMICASIPCDECQLKEMCNDEIKNKINQDEIEDNNNEL